MAHEIHSPPASPPEAGESTRRGLFCDLYQDIYNMTSMITIILINCEMQNNNQQTLSYGISKSETHFWHFLRSRVCGTNRSAGFYLLETLKIYWIYLATAASSSRGSCGAGSFAQVGSTPQISRAYSAIVRSLENLPELAMLWMAILVQRLWSSYV